MTDDTVRLQEHMEELIAGLRREIQASLAACETGLNAVRREMETREQWSRDTLIALQRAMDKAEGEMREKLAIMNEFRSAMDDQQRTFARQADMDQVRVRIEQLATRTEIEARFKSRDDLIADLRLRSERTVTRAELATTVRAREVRFQAVEARVTDVEGWKHNMQGRMWSIPIGIGLLVFIITQVMRVLFPI